MKLCVRCHFNLDNNLFTQAKKTCNNCMFEKRKEYYLKNKHKIKTAANLYYTNNKEKVLKRSSDRYLKNKDDILSKNSKRYEANKNKYKENRKIYYANNATKLKALAKEYRENHKSLTRKWGKEWEIKRRHNDPSYKLRKNISRQISYYLFKNDSKKGGVSITLYLGYPFQKLKEHLENQFEPWMTWNNYGKYVAKIWNDNDTSTWTWQIDHIIPQTKLPYISMEDDNFKKCWALDNLRPLSAKQNIIKGAR